SCSRITSSNNNNYYYLLFLLQGCARQQRRASSCLLQSRLKGQELNSATCGRPLGRSLFQVDRSRVRVVVNHSFLGLVGCRSRSQQTLAALTLAWTRQEEGSYWRKKRRNLMYQS